MDDGAFPDLWFEEHAPDAVCSDDRLIIPDELFGAARSELVANFDDEKIGVDFPSLPALSSSPILIPEDFWGEPSDLVGEAEPALVADSESHDVPWPPQNEGDSDVDKTTLVAGTGLTVSALTGTTRAIPQSPRPPTPAPEPVRRSLGGLQPGRRVAAVALIVLAGAGLPLALAARGPDGPPTAVAQVDAGGTRPHATMPTSTVPPPAPMSLSAGVDPTPPATSTGEAPATISPSPSSPAATIPITADAPRSTARTAAPAPSPEPSPAQSPQPTPTPTPTPAPTPAPTATEAPPTTAAAVPPETVPESSPTTRRPPPTVPDSTVPDTTVPETTSPSTTLPTSISRPPPPSISLPDEREILGSLKYPQ